MPWRRNALPTRKKPLSIHWTFFKEMMGIRNSGYAVNTGEWQATVCGVAVPVRDPAGEVIAAASAIEAGLCAGPVTPAPIDPCGIGQVPPRTMPMRTGNMQRSGSGSNTKAENPKAPRQRAQKIYATPQIGRVCAATAPQIQARRRLTDSSGSRNPMIPRQDALTGLKRIDL